MPPDNYSHNARSTENLLPEILALWIFIISYRFGRLAENLSFCNLLESSSMAVLKCKKKRKGRSVFISPVFLFKNNLQKNYYYYIEKYEVLMY